MRNNLVNSKSENVFVSWSGGKDAYLALLRAQDMGLETTALLNFQDNSGRSRSHGLKDDILTGQARSLNMDLEKEYVDRGNYEAGFEKAVERLKERGITGGVFGDINLEEHREWIEKMCQRCGINFYLPLWQMGEREVSEELLERRGHALIVSVRNGILEDEWLGKLMDKHFLDYCAKIGISPCGERGEFHTLVVNGTSFEYPLPYQTGSCWNDEKYTYLPVSIKQE